MHAIERWECPEHGDAMAARPRTIRDKRVKGCGICGLELVQVKYVRADDIRGAVSTDITKAELDAAWRAWVDAWTTRDGRSAMVVALRAFLTTREAVGA